MSAILEDSGHQSEASSCSKKLSNKINSPTSAYSELNDRLPEDGQLKLRAKVLLSSIHKD